MLFLTGCTNMFITRFTLFFYISIFLHLYLELVAEKKTIQNKTSSSLTQNSKMYRHQKGVFVIQKKGEKSWLSMRKAILDMHKIGLIILQMVYLNMN